MLENAIEFVTFERGTWVDVTDGFFKGSTTLTLSNASGFFPGMYAEIQQENDADVMYTQAKWDTVWADSAVGQIVEIIAVDGNTITTVPPLHIDFQASLNPHIRTQGFVEFSGAENFHIKRLDSGKSRLFYFKNAANCWIANVHSELAKKGHVYANTAYRLEVRDNFFDDASNHSGGGHGYGVELIRHTSNCLVENNIFKHLRHSMMVHIGASGNVFGYNYSTEPFWTNNGSTPPDISVHGHYPFANLFEGNIVQEVGVADNWGPAGPWNTYFRNSIASEESQSEGIRIDDNSDYQNIIGNEIIGRNIEWDNTVDAKTLIIHGNAIDGVVSWDPNISDHNLPDSYYLNGKPAFYADMNWPSTGSDHLNGTNPAKKTLRIRLF